MLTFKITILSRKKHDDQITIQQTNRPISGLTDLFNSTKVSRNMAIQIAAQQSNRSISGLIDLLNVC